MEKIVVRIGGTVQPEQDPGQELANIARITSGDEFSEWMRDYEAGNWLLVRVELFAEALLSTGVRRYYDDSVHALSFSVPHVEDNVDHAREVVRSSVDALVDVLQANGVPADPESLAVLPIVIELGPEVEKRLAA